jgi:hypothetical protein
MEKYGGELLKIVASDLFQSTSDSISKITSFFELNQCLKRNIVCNRLNVKDACLKKLPVGILTHILSFCSKKDLFSIAQVSKSMNAAALNPYLWREISFLTK